jgi:hypothetical protein
VDIRSTRAQVQFAQDALPGAGRLAILSAVLNDLDHLGLRRLIRWPRIPQWRFPWTGIVDRRIVPRHRSIVMLRNQRKQSCGTSRRQSPFPAAMIRAGPAATPKRAV